MNRNLVLKTLGFILLCEAAAMIPALLVALKDGTSDAGALAQSIVVISLTGALGAAVPLRSSFVGYREGFLIATLGWLLLSAGGALPFLWSGVLVHPADAFFETMSGFTTTGASVLGDIEILPRGLLFWRSMTHWLGGMGTIVLILALIPSLRIAGLQLYRAEVPGPTKTKVVPRIAQTSRHLYLTYFFITALQAVLLMVAGLNWFDALIHTFGTVATGGFSNYNLSVGALNNLTAEIIIIIFMLICGMNFALHVAVLSGRPQVLWRDAEVRVYLIVVVIATLLVGLNLSLVLHYDFGFALRLAAFQVVSIITTTGFATVDFNTWPEFSRMVLLVLMFIGGCAGSTAGAIKVIRLVILAKNLRRQFVRLIHPQAVIPLRVGGEVIPEAVVSAVQAFFFAYLAIFTAATLYLTTTGLDMISAVSAVAATLGNVGPGLGAVGPTSNYALLPADAKIILSICMLIGRLEIFTVLVVFTSNFWSD